MTHYLTVFGYIMAITAALSVETIDTATPMPVPAGWGGPSCTAITNVNDGFDCSTTANGVVCTVTVNNITYPAYDAKPNCEAKTSIGLLKRPQ